MNLNEYISDTLLEIVFFNGEYLISGCMPASTVHAHMALRQNPPIFLRQGRPHLSQSLHAKSTHKSRHVTAGNKHTEQYRYWSESEIMPGLHCTSPLNFLGLFVWVHANHSSPARIIPPPPLHADRICSFMNAKRLPQRPSQLRMSLPASLSMHMLCNFIVFSGDCVQCIHG